MNSSWDGPAKQQSNWFFFVERWKKKGKQQQPKTWGRKRQKKRENKYKKGSETNLKKFLIIVPGLSLTLASDEVAVVVVTTVAVGLTVVTLIDLKLFVRNNKKNKVTRDSPK